MRSFALASLALLIAVPAASQQWTAEEQEIIDFTNGCWEMWQQENVDSYLSDCWHEDITFWWSENAMPFGARWVSRASRFWFGQTDMAVWDVQPHRINIFGDAAVFHYQLLGVDDPAEGPAQFWGNGRTDFLVRENGAWKVVAVHQHRTGEDQP